MTIWRIFFSIFEPFSQFKLFFFCIFFVRPLFLFFLTSNLVLLINSHHCFRQQKNAAKISKEIRQKPRRRKEKHWDSNCGGWGLGEGAWGGVDLTSSGHIYNRKDEGGGGVVGEWAGECGVRLHRSTGLRSWTARGGRAGAEWGSVTSAAVCIGGGGGGGSHQFVEENKQNNTNS